MLSCSDNAGPSIDSCASSCTAFLGRPLLARVTEVGSLTGELGRPLLAGRDTDELASLAGELALRFVALAARGVAWESSALISEFAVLLLAELLDERVARDFSIAFLASGVPGRLRVAAGVAAFRGRPLRFGVAPSCSSSLRPRSGTIVVVAPATVLEEDLCRVARRGVGDWKRRRLTA